MRIPAVALTLLLATGLALPCSVIFYADDMGIGDVGCYGCEDIATPNIDALAADGVRFTNAFVTASSCSPSRASIMTGQAPHSVGVLGLTHEHPKYQMSTKVPTLAEALKRKGYNTAHAGKWHVAPYRPVTSYGYKKQLDVMEILNTDKILNFIRTNKDNPFFMELNFFQTHRPNFGGPEYRQHPDFPVDTAFPDNRGIEHIGPVGGQTDDCTRRFQAVHFGEELRHDRAIDVARNAGAATVQDRLRLARGGGDLLGLGVERLFEDRALQVLGAGG